MSSSRGKGAANRAAGAAIAPAAAAASAASSGPVVRTTPIVKTKPVFVTVDSLDPESTGRNLIVQVVELKAVLNRTLADGSQHRISEALIGDSTGTILLTLKNDQGDLVKVGDWLYVRNCKVEMFRAHMRVAVDKWGLIEKIQSAKDQPQGVQIKLDNNLSATEYELVTVPA